MITGAVAMAMPWCAQKVARNLFGTKDRNRGFGQDMEFQALMVGSTAHGPWVHRPMHMAMCCDPQRDIITSLPFCEVPNLRRGSLMAKSSFAPKVQSDFMDMRSTEAACRHDILQSTQDFLRTSIHEANESLGE
jgi:hypothetical protein